MNCAPEGGLHKLEYAIHALDGINHGITAALEIHSAITPMQIYCMLELVSGTLNESLAELGELQ
ncbi:MAG: hypothetical protein ACXV79_00850 [Methylobacter sp.]